MASVIFKRMPSDTRQQRYQATFSPTGQGIPRKKQLAADEMTELHPLPPNQRPIGLDTRAPLRKGDKLR